MKKLILLLCLILVSFTSKATIHIVNVWDGYFKFVDAINFSQDITIQLGDTVQWLPLDPPQMIHTITSTNIPSGATAFDQIWQAPADTFFQYIPQIVGLYEYECTPHALSHGMIGSINVIDGVNGVSNKLLMENDLLIYPNPTTNSINFKESGVVYFFDIYNLKGQFKLSGTTDTEVNVATLVNGVYIIKVVGDNPHTLKLIKE